MNPYLELKTKHQKEIDEFPFGFAFNETQFNEMMKKWKLSPDDTDKIYKFDIGSFVRKCDADAMHEMFERHAQEREEAIRENKDNYLFHMFNYELANHEYTYTYDLTDTLDALGLTMEEIEANAVMLDALNKAIKHQESLDW